MKIGSVFTARYDGAPCPCCGDPVARGDRVRVVLRHVDCEAAVDVRHAEHDSGRAASYSAGPATFTAREALESGAVRFVPRGTVPGDVEQPARIAAPGGTVRIAPPVRAEVVSSVPAGAVPVTALLPERAESLRGPSGAVIPGATVRTVKPAETLTEIGFRVRSDGRSAPGEKRRATKGGSGAGFSF